MIGDTCLTARSATPVPSHSSEVGFSWLRGRSFRGCIRPCLVDVPIAISVYRTAATPAVVPAAKSHRGFRLGVPQPFGFPIVHSGFSSNHESHRMPLLRRDGFVFVRHRLRIVTVAWQADPVPHSRTSLRGHGDDVGGQSCLRLSETLRHSSRNCGPKVGSAASPLSPAWSCFSKRNAVFSPRSAASFNAL